MADLKQFVNLPGPPPAASNTVRKLLADNAETDVERLGAIVPKLTFKKPTTAFAKVRLTKAGNNIEYDTAKEGTRNPHFFNAIPAGARVKPEGVTEYAVDEPVPVPAAGGNVYRLEGKDVGDKIVKSKTFEAHRYLEWAMVGTAKMYDGHEASQKELKDVIDGFERYLKKEPHFIHTKLVDGTTFDVGCLYEVAAEGQTVMTVSDNYEDAKSAAFKKVIFTSNDVAFVVMMVPFIAQCATLTFDDLTEGTPLGLAGPAVAGPVSWVLDEARRRIVITVNEQRALWYGLDGKDKPVGPRPDDSMLIALRLGWNGRLLGGVRRDQSHVVDIEYKQDGTKKFAVDLKEVWHHVKGHENDPVQFMLGLRLVNGWNCGIQLGDGVIAVAARSSGYAHDAEELVATLLHEFGHMVGLPGVGDKRESRKHTPDSHDGYYDHTTDPQIAGRGTHCKTGYTQESTWAKVRHWLGGWEPGVGTCMMFGFDNGATDFCDDCKKVLRKVDLSAIRR